MLKWLKRFWCFKENPKEEKQTKAVQQNPFLVYFRRIIEQILEKYKIYVYTNDSTKCSFLYCTHDFT